MGQVSAWRQARAALLFPGLATIGLPLLIVVALGTDSLDVGTVGAVLCAAVGAVLLLLGLSLGVWTVRLFDNVGDGTLAPFDPPRHLVLYGPYRYVRNPMISGVFGIVLGEAVAFRSPWLALWWVVFYLGNQLYIPLHEERALQRRFGAEYTAYCAAVRRWVPRLTPWSPTGGGASHTHHGAAGQAA